MDERRGSAGSPFFGGGDGAAMSEARSPGLSAAKTGGRVAAWNGSVADFAGAPSGLHSKCFRSSGVATMRSSSLLFGTALAIASGAAAQDAAPRIWDLKLGIAVAELPLSDYDDPACGTNGGPPARVLRSFADFAQCPVEAKTGLR